MGAPHPAADGVPAGDVGGGLGALHPGRANKYGARRAEGRDGRRFASVAERDRDAELALLERAGEIAGLQRQPSWHFPVVGPDGVRRDLTTATGRRVRYTADWSYTETRTGKLVVEERKGVMQRDAALRIALMKAVHGIEVLVTGMGARTRRRAPRRR